MVEEVKQDERLDSIRVSQGASEKFGFEVKRYFDYSKDDPKLVIQSIEKMYDELKGKFKGEE